LNSWESLKEKSPSSLAATPASALPRRTFVVEGAHVYVTGRRQAELNAAVAHIGSNATAVHGDVSKPEDLDRLYRQVKHEKGKLDVLFANAGIGPRARLGEITDKHIDDLLSIDIKGVILTVQKALPLLAPERPSF
jgi:NAD(P)-dependent dehydrogenase (short-subunit alcohol dehydrogenase family)